MGEPRIIGRYALYGEIASGGMATVHLGRILGAGGFSRPVAIKRLHPQFARDPEFVAMFLDEARLASRISHPNVVPTLDVVQDGNELLLVMDYVRGASLSRMLRGAAATQAKLPPRVVTAIACDVLHGLHAAHEAKGDQGEPLNIVHRDISPQNVIVGTDGVARVLDFGVAKAAGRLQQTREGQIKGKVAYMPPEQIKSQDVTRRADLYAVGVVLWESLVADRLFRADNDVAVLQKVLEGSVPPPSTRVPDLPAAFDAVVAKALQKDAAARYATAREMASELEACVQPASPTEVGEWVERLASDELHDRASRIAEIERSASTWSAKAMHPPPAPSSEPATRVEGAAVVAAASTTASAVAAAPAPEPATRVEAPAPALLAAAAAPVLAPAPPSGVPYAAPAVQPPPDRSRSTLPIVIVLAVVGVGFIGIAIAGLVFLKMRAPAPALPSASETASAVAPPADPAAPDDTTSTSATAAASATTRSASSAGATTAAKGVAGGATTSAAATLGGASPPPAAPATTAKPTSTAAPPPPGHGKPDCKDKKHGKCP